jgi:hypothetical protein
MHVSSSRRISDYDMSPSMKDLLASGGAMGSSTIATGAGFWMALVADFGRISLFSGYLAKPSGGGRMTNSGGLGLEEVSISTKSAFTSSTIGFWGGGGGGGAWTTMGFSGGGGFLNRD